MNLLDMDVYCTHDVDNVLNPPLPRGISDRFPFAVSRGLPLGSYRYNNSTQSHAIDTRYSSLPSRVPDLFSRCGILRPFSLLLPGYPPLQRATIYIICLLLKACVRPQITLHVSTSDPRSRILFAAFRFVAVIKRHIIFPSDRQTSLLFIVLPLQLST